MARDGDALPGEGPRDLQTLGNALGVEPWCVLRPRSTSLGAFIQFTNQPLGINPEELTHRVSQLMERRGAPGVRDQGREGAQQRSFCSQIQPSVSQYRCEKEKDAGTAYTVFLARVETSWSGAQAWGWSSDSATYELAKSLPLHLRFLIWEKDLIVAPL